MNFNASAISVVPMNPCFNPAAFNLKVLSETISDNGAVITTTCILVVAKRYGIHSVIRLCVLPNPCGA